MPWHFSCRFGPSILISLRSTELLLTPRLDTQATFAKLFADIGIDGDVRYARIEDLLRHGPPAPASITARHVQALRADLRAETLSHAAGLTSHTTLLVFGKSGFVGTDEAGHGRSTVGLTRARDTTILLGLPDPYGLTGLVQTTYAYYFSVHTAYWQLPDAPLPLSLGPQDVDDVLVRAGILSCPSLFTCAPQEVQLTAVPGVALLSEASVSPVVSLFS